MNLTFPFRNITCSDLNDFFEGGKLSDFNDFKSKVSPWKEELFYESVQNWKDYLQNFENEILQIVNTTNKNTVDSYFKLIIDDIDFFTKRCNKEYFHEKIPIWNKEIKEYYENRMQPDEDIMLSKENKVNSIQNPTEIKDNFIFDFSFLNSSKANIHKHIEKPNFIDISLIDDYLSIVTSMFSEFKNICNIYIEQWKEGRFHSVVQGYIPKPIVFVEGTTDIQYISKAAEYLQKQELLKRIELQHRGGAPSLNRLWNSLKERNWERIPQTKILLYDCDSNKVEEDSGTNHIRTIPFKSGKLIIKGIENLLSDEIIRKAKDYKTAFIDVREISEIKRGILSYKKEYEINNDEKTNLCEWICNNSCPEDFENFRIIFNMIEDIIDHHAN